MKTVFRTFFLLTALSFVMLSCEDQEAEELTLEFLQANEIRQEEGFKFKAVVEVFDFKTNSTRLIDRGNTFQIEARQAPEIISMFIPFLGVGTFSGSTDSLVRINYLDRNGRLFSSSNPRFTSNAVIRITAIDTLEQTFNGTFSGKLYDTNSPNPARSEDQIVISGGELFKFNY